MEESSMAKSRWFRVLACLTIVAFFACGQQALAQGGTQSTPRFRIKALPKTQPQVPPDITDGPPADLFPLTAAFTATSYPTVNSDGSDLWPCKGDTSLPKMDCPAIGDPSVTFPTGGLAVGVPAYVWSLSACDGTMNGSSVGGSPTYIPCGQTETFYEDDTGDSTDDVLYRVEVTQGTGTNTKIIADSGTQDFGPDPFAHASPPADFEGFTGDMNFGTLGVPTGPNNGNCDADFNYPATSDTSAVFPFTIAANKTCVDPVAGLATVTATTEFATPRYTKKMTVAACAPSAPPCYRVTYTKKYSITQKWDIWFQ
jgi:hypothetical protein